jgi:glycosyltransferase involved in cell wall biosynthesis
MRILHTAHTYAPSLDGVAEVVRHISEGLARRGHEVHVATSARLGTDFYSEINGVHVHRFQASGNQAIGMRGQIDGYRNFIRSGVWDVQVNHCLQIWTTDAVLEEIWSYPWPSILVTHGLSGFSLPTYAEYFDQIPQYLQSYRAWVTISNAGEEFPFVRKYGLREPVFITNGVDLKEWAQPSLGLRQAWGINAPPWIVNVSNHSCQKGHRVFFQLAHATRQFGTRFTLVAGTHRALKAGLGKLGVRGGCYYNCMLRSTLSGCVALKTNIKRAEVISAIQEADLVVSTSSWEANSVVLLESMAAGTPWVSFDVGSARCHAGGIVVDSIKEMSSVVNELLQDPSRRKQLGSEGRERIALKHDWNTIAAKYEQLYQAIISGELKSIVA